MEFEFQTPAAIEAESMRRIRAGLAQLGIALPPEHQKVVERVIHTTADFDYARSLVFTPGAVERGVAALKAGETVVTDTNMARAGINAAARAQLGVEAVCYMADPQVADSARERGLTRAVVSMERGASEHPGGIYAVGNAPTALFALEELMERGALSPALIVAVPVGFVNVVESKESILALCRRRDIPIIAAMGRKGGSTVAAAILNALLYEAAGRTL